MIRFDMTSTPTATPSPFGVDDALRWQFARTMPRWPHEYTVRHWRPDLEAELEAFEYLIREIGVVKPWPRTSKTPKYHHTYLTIEDFEYWTMGAPISVTTVINRAVWLAPR
jgi:hypothetical protein